MKNHTPIKIIVAVTGASGAIYARLLVERLLDADSTTEIALIFSENGREVTEYEGETIRINDPRITLYDNVDMFAPPASGSARFDAMVVVPCSMGALGRIAGGVSGDLIARSADVMLKERRKLILVARETPLNTIHLTNMTTLSQCGAIILPASPSFYSHPSTIESLCGTVVDRILSLLGVDSQRFEWGAVASEHENNLR